MDDSLGFMEVDGIVVDDQSVVVVSICGDSDELLRFDCVIDALKGDVEVKWGVIEDELSVAKNSVLVNDVVVVDTVAVDECREVFIDCVVDDVGVKPVSVADD